MKTIITILTLSLFHFETQAQINSMPQKNKINIQKELNLSEAQASQLKTIRIEARDQYTKNKSTFANDKKSLQAANFNLKISTDNKIKSILSTDQFQKLQGIQLNKHKEKILVNAENTATSLNLSADQKKQFYEAVAARDSKMQENQIKYSQNLEQLQKANKDARKSFNCLISSIFSPSQLTQWEQIRKSAKNNNLQK